MELVSQSVSQLHDRLRLLQLFKESVRIELLETRSGRAVGLVQLGHELRIFPNMLGPLGVEVVFGDIEGVEEEA